MDRSQRNCLFKNIYFAVYLPNILIKSYNYFVMKKRNTTIMTASFETELSEQSLENVILFCKNSTKKQTLHFSKNIAHNHLATEMYLVDKTDFW